MNKILYLIIFLFSTAFCEAQTITSGDYKKLQTKEDSLKRYALDIVQGESADDRFAADSMFTRMFVRALQTKNSI